MTVTFLCDGVQGKAAIYTGSDDLPFSAPTSYPDRTLFHTDLPTIGIVDTWETTVTTVDLGVWGGSDTLSGRQSITLFAHGQSGTPYVEGIIVTGTPGITSAFNYSQSNVTLAGSVPLGSFNFVHLGADSAYVYLNHLYLRVPGSYTGYWTLSLKVFVTDYLL